ncbi:cobalamin biosynthesis protein CobG [Streptomyces sp. NPDC006879]|uniref:cobalamin biosynthesis protein CobG n=1 Tax=Streptomyces sp. NPDC006879 TaxID=3364767 RepID=UPI0036C31B70
MSASPTTPCDQGQAPLRERGDACPGALRLHTADDGRLARLRLPGGLLSGVQARVLAAVAERFGDGWLSITSRGNVELRGLGESCGGELARDLRDAGLLPSETHERVRNILATPLAGLDGHGRGDLRPWVRELDELLCSRPWAAALSGRFLFALDDGRGDVAELGADVTLIAAAAGSAELRIGPHRVRVAAESGPRAAVAAAGAFLTAAEAAGNGAWRVCELPAGLDVDPSNALERELGHAAASPVAAPEDLSDVAGGTGGQGAPHPAARPGRAQGPTGTGAVVVAARLGRMAAASFRLLAEHADEVRLTPWRTLVVPGGDEQALAAAGFLTDPDSPWVGVGACTGQPGCTKARADVRADAVPGSGGLPVHWSGCERRCGRPRGDWVDVLALGEGQYTVTVRGTREREVPVTATGLADAVTAGRDTTR